MKILLLIVCTALFYVSVSSQNIDVLIKSADQFEAVPDEEAAFDKFKVVLKIQPANMHALNKCSELCSRIGKRQTDKKLRDDYYKAAERYAVTALKLDSNNADANCAMAVALGNSALSKSGKEKIIIAKEIKKYVDRSLQNNPENFVAWYVLGKWNYELGDLNIIERTAARILYGDIPEGSLNGAIAAFKKSTSISEGFILNYLELAKAYEKNGENIKAIACINKMLLLPNKTEDDAAIKEQGKILLKEWQ